MYLEYMYEMALLIWRFIVFKYDLGELASPGYSIIFYPAVCLFM